MRLALRTTLATWRAQWAADWSTQGLRADAQAALFGVFLTLPQAVAFAALAQMPVAAAIWASFVPAIVAVLVSREAHVVSGPAAMLSLLLGATLVRHYAPGSPEFLAAAAVLVAMMAVFQLAAGVTGFVRVLHWIPAVSVRGITAGIGVSILLSQLATITGAQGIPTLGPLWAQAMATAHAPIHIAPVLVFVATLLVGWLLARAPWSALRTMRWPLAVVATSVLLQRPEVAVIGHLSLTLPVHWQTVLHPGVVVASSWPELLGPALTFAALALTQSMLVSEGAAIRGGQRMNLRREAYAQAAANAVSSLLCAFPVSASVNRSMAHEKAGAKTWRAAALSAALVMGLAVLVMPVISLLALPALAALLCVVAWGMVRGVASGDQRLVAVLFAVLCVFMGMGWTVLLALGYGIYTHAQAARPSWP